MDKTSKLTHSFKELVALPSEETIALAEAHGWWNNWPVTLESAKELGIIDEIADDAFHFLTFRLRTTIKRS